MQLFSFSLYDDDNKGYITKEDLDRCLLSAAARVVACSSRRRAQGVGHARQGGKRGAVPAVPCIPPLPCHASRCCRMFWRKCSTRPTRIRTAASGESLLALAAAAAAAL